MSFVVAQYYYAVFFNAENGRQGGQLVLRSEVALSSPPCVAGYAEQGRYFAE